LQAGSAAPTRTDDTEPLVSALVGNRKTALVDGNVGEGFSRTSTGCSAMRCARNFLDGDCLVFDQSIRRLAIRSVFEYLRHRAGWSSQQTGRHTHQSPTPSWISKRGVTKFRFRPLQLRLIMRLV
jgi:hypothetical protein